MRGEPEADNATARAEETIAGEEEEESADIEQMVDEVVDEEVEAEEAVETDVNPIFQGTLEDQNEETAGDKEQMDGIEEDLEEDAEAENLANLPDKELDTDFTLPRYNLQFYFKEDADNWSSFKDRELLPEEVAKKEDFSKQNLVKILKHRKLWKSVRNIGPNSPRVVREVYCNLPDQFAMESHPKYGKVYCRGRIYDFSPTRINEFLGTVDCDECPVPDEDIDVVLSAITGGLYKKWQKKPSVSLLTTMMNVCFKL